MWEATNLKRVLFVLAASIIAGCGGDVCSRTSQLQKDLNAKAASCQSMTFEGQVADCSTKLKSCSADDQAQLGKWFNCMEELPNCVAGQEDAWLNQFRNCAISNLGGTSSACQQAFSQ